MEIEDVGALSNILLIIFRAGDRHLEGAAATRPSREPKNMSVIGIMTVARPVPRGRTMHPSLARRFARRVHVRANRVKSLWEPWRAHCDLQNLD